MADSPPSTPINNTSRPQDILCQLEEGWYLEMIINGNARFRGTVDSVHNTPGIPGNEICDYERQIAANVADEGFEEAGDLHSWHISTRLVDGEWDEPIATGWFLEKGIGMEESFSQELTSLSVIEKTSVGDADNSQN